MLVGRLDSVLNATLCITLTAFSGYLKKLLQFDTINITVRNDNTSSKTKVLTVRNCSNIKHMNNSHLKEEILTKIYHTTISNEAKCAFQSTSRN